MGQFDAFRELKMAEPLQVAGNSYRLLYDPVRLEITVRRVRKPRVGLCWFAR